MPPNIAILRPTCCTPAATCAELYLYDGRDLDPPETWPKWSMIVDLAPDSPAGVDIIRSKVSFCPFCGKALPPPSP